MATHNGSVALAHSFPIIHGRDVGPTGLAKRLELPQTVKVPGCESGTATEWYSVAVAYPHSR